MRISRLDKVIAWLSPKAGIRRLAQKRAYEAAQTYSSSDWIGATKTSANAEVGAGQAELQRKSRDLARNNPYAVRALNVIVNNTVGAGILANIKGKNKTQVKKLNALWKQVAETSKCDVLGIHNFYGLQALALRSMVESGETIALKHVTPLSPSLKLLESDFIVSDQDRAPFVQGIRLDPNDKRISYLLYKQHPGDKHSTNGEYVEVPAERLIHLFRQDRPGQIRGVPWSHAVIETLKDFADFQNATLIARKISACFVGFIQTSGNDAILSATDLKAKREAEMQMNPGTFRYLAPGESASFSSPPGVDGYAEFVRESMRAVSAGYGISYEAMTGDYSQVNYSSGRMGGVEFRRNIEAWRWNILVPQFCEPYFQTFLEWAKAKGLDVDGAYVEWVPPAYVMIDPTKEIEALKREVRAGFKTYGQAVREQGLDPDETLTEIAEWNKKFDDLQLSFDSDARRLSNVGFAHPKDTLPLLSEAENLKPDEVEDSEEQNEEDATDERDSSGG